LVSKTLKIHCSRLQRAVQTRVALSVCKYINGAGKGSKMPTGLKKNGNRDTIFTGPVHKGSIQQAASGTFSCASLTHTRFAQRPYSVLVGGNHSCEQQRTKVQLQQQQPPV